MTSEQRLWIPSSSPFATRGGNPATPAPSERFRVASKPQVAVETNPDREVIGIAILLPKERLIAPLTIFEATQLRNKLEQAIRAYNSRGQSRIVFEDNLLRREMFPRGSKERAGG